MIFDYNVSQYNKMTSCLRLDCGKSATIQNTEKQIVKQFSIFTNALFGSSSLESVVEYSCVGDYHVVPTTADTTHQCLTGGSWSSENFECLKGV